MLLQKEALLPCIWFILNRIGCDESVLRLQDHGESVLTPQESKLVSDALDKMR